MKLNKPLLLLAILWCLYIPTAKAHELPSNRLTLVLRQQKQLSLTYYIQCTETLHSLLAPNNSLAEFLLLYASKDINSLSQDIQRAEHTVEQETILLSPKNKPITLSHWQWPSAQEVQAMLQKQLMQGIVAPEEHAHEEPITVLAEALLPSANNTYLNVQLPEALLPVMVVSYRPQQVWVRKKRAVIKF